MGMDGQRFSVVPSGYNKQKAIENGHRIVDLPFTH
jgi:hypothetical protein